MSMIRRFNRAETQLMIASSYLGQEFLTCGVSKNTLPLIVADLILQETLVYPERDPFIHRIL